MNLQSFDINFMRMAITASREAAEKGNTPFGALLARDEQMLLVAGNEERTSGDCTAHAETVLVRRAEQQLGRGALAGSTVYASGEPCAMCAGAMFWAGVTRIVYAATKDDIVSALGSPNLPMECASTLAGANPAVSVEGPFLREEAAAILHRFGNR
ncbi:MAG TPA: nucleoside deaminase [Polyangiales bacterium]|nr:nucleoside deaminase [Polyangiales bacterium]